ncbi:MAG: glutamate-5-semialdehyde dehydrogenase [Myxococcales bacterium]|nr:glutamate-5-semialdehyde dehydrogenase [Polyangiaceae bacterium]MDW8248731.1 glutamate-5-semialdehyde dehydrogenase [Myxococcales bacterium]
MDPLDIPLLCRRAREASRRLATTDGAARNGALRNIADALVNHQEELLAANHLDTDRARQAGTSEALVDRLVLTSQRIQAMARGVLDIAAQVDPVGEVTGMSRRPNGLLVGQVRVPLGVIAMIYEARPNVTVDAAALTLKSGNAVLLRGGSDARFSNEALGRVLRRAVGEAGLPEDAVQILPPLDQEATRLLLAQSGLIDLVIPRGGERLIRFVSENARVPVLQHYKGVCHLYVDEGADLDMALRLVENGKVQRPGTCNATECLLVHRSEAASLLPRVATRLLELDVEVRACPVALPWMPGARMATDDDWGHEFLDKILAVRVVESLDAALDHVARFGSNHTEAICTRSYERSRRWLQEVDASCVLVNASTRFNDGGELGLGAEIGISTSKLHAYGPMGAAHLTTLKWIVQGDGQIRS